MRPIIVSSPSNFAAPVVALASACAGVKSPKKKMECIVKTKIQYNFIGIGAKMQLACRGKFQVATRHATQMTGKLPPIWALFLFYFRMMLVLLHVHWALFTTPVHVNREFIAGSSWLFLPILYCYGGPRSAICDAIVIINCRFLVQHLAALTEWAHKCFLPNNF